MTSIEWTNETWNPTTGCDRTSPGCDRCYALTMAKRLKGMGSAKYQTDGDPRTSGPGFGLTVHPGVLTEPLRWKKPRRVFVNSMSDLFHSGVTDEYIARVFATMSLTPQHTYQILTKRHGRMRALLGDPEFEKKVDYELLHFPPFADPKLIRRSWPLPKPGWPLPNVWLGVSVEDQKRADLRIPALAQTPAAVRFLSCEPLLGPVDLTKWMPPIAPVPAAEAPKTWAEWTWPDWVPTEVRGRIEDFWSADQGRGPAHWIQDMHQQGAPAFGATLLMDDGFGNDPRRVTGRYVHAWNNIGRLVLADDPNRSFAYTSFGVKDRRRSEPIDWVIVGGESGPGARPMELDWASGLVEQCQRSKTAVFVKQLGSVWARTSGASDAKGGKPDDWPTGLRVREFPATSAA